MSDAVVINGHNDNEFIQDDYRDRDTNESSSRRMLYDYIEGDGLISSQQFRDEIREEVTEIVKEQLKLNSSSANTTSVSATAARATPGSSIKSVIPIADIRGADTLNYRKGEKVLRCKLASCYRLIDVCTLSSGTHSYITARLGPDQLLIVPYGLLYEEVTASSLVKLDMDGNIVDSGSTSLGVHHDEVSLHCAVYAARDNIKCIVHITSPSATMVSVMKSGLLPLCHESMVLGEVTYCDYFGSGLDEQDSIRDALGSTSQVLFLRNFGVIVVGETVEETYRIASNVMTATDTQVNLIAIGVNNLHLPSAQTIETAYNTERDLPPGVDPSRRWNYGEVEFEGLIRRLDNDGYCTGYIYKDTLLGLNRKRSTSVIDNRGKLSVFDERASGIASPLNQLLKRGKSPDWVVSPNVYIKQEEQDESLTRSGTLGRGESSKGKRLSHWVSAENVLNKPKQRSASMKVIGANKFAPLGVNPRELRDKVKEIRKEYFEDTITAGPQSTVLEGVTWEEAQRIKEGQPINGVDNVRVTAASRGIIQRDHQRDAIFYKKYTLTNPFENVTENDLEKYRRDVQKKAKKGYGGYAESEPELLSERRHISPVRCSTPPAKPARSMSPDQLETQQFVPARGHLQRSATDIGETEIRTAVRPVLTAQQQPNVQLQYDDDKLITKAPIISSDSSSVPSGERDIPQRSQSARFPAEKRPDPSNRSTLLDAPTPSGHSATLDTRGNKEGGHNLSAGHAATLDARSSKENSPAKDGEDGKAKKKKVPTATLR